jgi:cytochrome c oxidase subunit IV
MASHHSSLSPEEAKKANIRNIIRVTIYLALITTVEFILAFAWPMGMDRTMLNILFLALTLVKAFYIVAEFMHLGGEVKTLIMAIVLPLVFIVWLTVALWIEGAAIFGAGA